MIMLTVATAAVDSGGDGVAILGPTRLPAVPQLLSPVREDHAAAATCVCELGPRTVHVVQHPCGKGAVRWSPSSTGEVPTTLRWSVPTVDTRDLARVYTGPRQVSRKIAASCIQNF